MTQYKRTLQSQFNSAFRTGWLDEVSDFSSACGYLETNKGLNVLPVIRYPIQSGDSETLRKLFTYYNENVVNKLDNIAARHQAHEKLKKAVEDALQSMHEEEQNPDMLSVVNAEFPGDDKDVTRDFDDVPMVDGHDTGMHTKDNGDVDATGQNDLSFSDWTAVLSH